MGRPRGWQLSKNTFDDLLVIRRLSRTELAEQAEVSPQMLGDLYGKKRAGASIKTARALASVLDVSVETLFPEAEGFGPLTQPEAAVA